MPETQRKLAPFYLPRERTHAVMSSPEGPLDACPEGGRIVAKPTPAQRREDREKLTRVTEQLAALKTMTTSDLAKRLEELTGMPSRTRNPQYLRKRVAWHLQAAEFGGLPEAALAKIDELAPLAMKAFDPATRRRVRPSAGLKGAAAGNARDPRLPAPGAILTRTYAEEIHEVTVLDDGFDYRGERYRSLSKIAREITGTAWNGYTFFGCAARQAASGEGAA